MMHDGAMQRTALKWEKSVHAAWMIGKFCACFQRSVRKKVFQRVIRTKKKAAVKKFLKKRLMKRLLFGMFGESINCQ